VVAADAAEAKRATLPAGCDVVRFQADAVGRGDFSDGPPYVFGVQHRLCFAPDAVAATVELQGGDPVDGLATSFLADLMVTSGIGTV
jgi:hypothetical protein